MKKLQTLVGILSFLGVCTACSGTVFANKINFSIAPTITEGASQVIQLSLDQPIICPGAPGSPCDVSLTFTSSDAHVSAPPTVLWHSYEWAQPRIITINTTNDGIYTGDRAATVSSTAVSDATYYNNYALTIPITILDQDPAPPVPGITDKTVTVTTGKSTEVDVLTGVSGNPDASTLTIITAPLHGTAVDPPSTITYTPAVGYVGSDSLTYQVCSSLSHLICGTAVLSFSVVAALIPPANTSIRVPDTGFLPESNTLTVLFMASTLACVVMSGYHARKLSR